MMLAEHPPLAGRDREQRDLDRAVATAAGGEAAVVALFGEAGIGKSALMRSLAERAEGAGLRVLEARAAEHERDVPFALAVEALDDAADRIGPSRFASLGPERQAELAAVLPSVSAPAGVETPSAGAEERFRLHRALRALLELLAGERPVALLLDDVHWADAASLELLLHLIRRPPRAPHLLAFALRPVEPSDRLRDALRTAPSPTVGLTLEPLGRAAALELVAGVGDPAQRERIAAEAGGNPLFLQELARVGTGAGALPPTILAAVRLELDALDPASRTLLDGAAVAGDPFDPELAAAAADLMEDGLVALDQLVAADLVRPADGPRAFRFRHPLFRRAVYDATPPAWRLGAHQRVAAVLAARGASAVVRAYHVERCATAGDREAVTVLAAAAASTASSSPVTAARWYRAALDLLPSDAGDERVALLGPLAAALATAGRVAEAGEVLDEVLALLPPEPSPLRALLVGSAAALENLLGRHAAARARLLATFDQLPPGTDPATRAAVAIELGVCEVFEQQGEEALRWGRIAVPDAGAQPALLATAHAVVAIGSIWTGRREEAGAALTAAAAALAAAPDEELLLRPEVFFYLPFAQIFDERYEEARATAERGVAKLLALGQARSLGATRGLHAMALFGAGRYAAAEELIEAAEEAARLHGGDSPLQFALWLRAQFAYERGDGVERRRATADLHEVLTRLPSSTSTRTGLANVATLLLEEDPQRCIRDLLAAAGERLEGVEPTWLTALVRVLVRALIAVGRLDEARHYAALGEEHGARLRLPNSIDRARVARSEVLLAEGDAVAAADLAVGVVASLERRGAGGDAHDARPLAGRALAAAGRTDEAIAMLRRATQIAAEDGANRLRDAAASELRKLGVRVRGASAGGAAGEELTERERAIADLVASGSTNKQVGAALFLSEKTVESHVSRVYAKLGVRSRVELAALWRAG